MIDLPYPNINGETDEKKIAQIQNYLIQLKDILEFTLMSMSSENMAMSETLAKGLNESNVVREDHMSQVSSKMTSEADSTMSAIQQTADNIMIEVGKKTSADDVKALIHMNANGEIEMSGNKISIDSTNFKLTKEGKVTATDMDIKGGSFKITKPSFDDEVFKLESDNNIIVFHTNILEIYDKKFKTFAEYADNSVNFGTFTGTPWKIPWSEGTTKEWNASSYSKDGADITGNLWVGGTLYTASGTVSKSDREAKDEIKELDAVKSSNFIYSLKPCEYKYKDGSSGRLHHGFIAQEVKESMGADDWGLYVDYGEHKALRYEEIIADLVATVQAQNERIKQLEEKL